MEMSSTQRQALERKIVQHLIVALRDIGDFDSSDVPCNEAWPKLFAQLDAAIAKAVQS